MLRAPRRAARPRTSTFEHFDFGADRYLKRRHHDAARARWSGSATSSTRSSSARSAIRACRRTCTRATSCSARASGSTSTSTCARSSCSTTRLSPLKGKGPEDIDIVVFRENTEGIYVGHRRPVQAGHRRTRSRSSEEINTRKGVERIIRAAFEYAQAHGNASRCAWPTRRTRCATRTSCGGASSSEVGDGVPGDRGRRTSTSTRCAMELVQRPERFDVIVTNNLFGDIVTDLGAALQGGLGLAARGQHAPRAGVSLFEPVHGSAPDIAGKGIANPLAAILTAGMMLAHLGHPELETPRSRTPSAAASRAGKVTRELGGNARRPPRSTDAVLADLDAAEVRADAALEESPCLSTSPARHRHPLRQAHRRSAPSAAR